MPTIAPIKYLGREFRGLKTAFEAGTRCARINNKPASAGIAFGARQVYKRVGPFPIVAGLAAATTLPVPGACATGIVFGNLITKSFKTLLKLIK